MWVDPDKIDQVLGNLLENAVRHGAGHGHHRASSPAEATAAGASVTVSDEGEGIPEELRRPRLHPVLAAGRRGGTGLGLYIVRGLVEAHGGTIEVGRGPGGGAGSDSCCPPATPDFAD